MSGGSYDYFYGRIAQFAESIENQDDDPRRAAFARHLRLVAKAARHIEWVDSDDAAPGSEHAAIRAVIGPAAELEEAVMQAEAARGRLDLALRTAGERLDATDP